MKMTLLFLMVSGLAHAGVRGHDDRQESQVEVENSFLRDLARSVPAIVENRMLLPEGANFRPEGYSLSKMGYCSDVRFKGQQYLARCSASLIAPDLVLTAGHCIDDKLEEWCKGYSVVFDYAVGLGDKLIQRENVFACEKVLYRNFEMPFGEDLAVIRLKRPVLGRTPIVVQPELRVGSSLVMIGYPMGLPQKTVENGEVTKLGNLKVSFMHTLDTFSSNSGGPIFTTNGEQVGVLVRGTGPNQTPRPGARCSDWGTDKESDYAEGNTLAHLIPLLTGWGMPSN